MGCTSSSVGGRGSIFTNPLPPLEQEETDGISPVKQSTQSEKERNATGQACFGAGCYWGTEKFFSRTFSKVQGLPPGKLVSGKVGFMGPVSAPPNPNYEDVCTGKTGHVEVYNFEYTGGDEFYEAAVRYFFQFHDPTTLNRQGNDAGTQYASVIYCYTKLQFDIATRVKEQLQLFLNNGNIPKGTYQSVRVSTDIRMVETQFFEAKQEHQDYLTKNPTGYCNHRLRLQTWPVNN